MIYVSDPRQGDNGLFYKVTAAVSDLLQENMMYMSQTIVQENKKTLNGTFEDRVKLKEKLLSSSSSAAVIRQFKLDL